MYSIVMSFLISSSHDSTPTELCHSAQRWRAAAAQGERANENNAEGVVVSGDGGGLDATPSALMNLWRGFPKVRALRQSSDNGLKRFVDSSTPMNDNDDVPAWRAGSRICFQRKVL
jgi:hypothetical protein